MDLRLESSSFHLHPTSLQAALVELQAVVAMLQAGPVELQVVVDMLQGEPVEKQSDRDDY